MTEEPKPLPRLIRACVFWGILLTSFYGGIYWSLAGPGLVIRAGRTRSAPRYSEHRGTQKTLEIVFWPAYQVDYFVRPTLWQVEFSDEPLMMLRDAL